MGDLYCVFVLINIRWFWSIWIRSNYAERWLLTFNAVDPEHEKLTWQNAGTPKLKNNLVHVPTASPICLFHVMPRHHLTSLILKYAGNTLLDCSALVTQSLTVYWSPAECGGATCGLSLPAAPWGAASIGPERPWEAPGRLLFKVSPLCHWGSWAERGIQRVFRAKTWWLKKKKKEPQAAPLCFTVSPHIHTPRAKASQQQLTEKSTEVNSSTFGSLYPLCLFGLLDLVFRTDSGGYIRKKEWMTTGDVLSLKYQFLDGTIKT